MAKLYFSLTNLFVLIFFSCIVSQDVHAATVYRWVDKHGKTHFSQTPPNGETREYDVRFAKEKPKSEPVASKDAKDGKAGESADNGKDKDKDKPKTPQERLAEIEKARAEQSKIATEKAKQRDERTQKCQKAQENMRNIDQGGRIYDVNKSGEREYWDDSKRAEKKALAQEHIDKYCDQ